MGTSAKIFEAQTASFRSILPPHYTWDFVEGEHECPPADNVDQIFAAPYLCYYNLPSIDNVREAHESLREIVHEEGPFDAVMGFSQGAALAASFLLHHQIEHPYIPPPFRLAIFVCASLPFSISPNHGLDVTDYYAATGDTTAADLDYLKSFTKYDGLQSDFTGTAELGKDETAFGPRIFRFHPHLDEIRIEIPTVHVYGRQDHYYAQSKYLVELCESIDDRVFTYEHPFGHLVPKSKEATTGIAKVVEDGFTRADFFS
ncbi:hypothetical protein L228DRAFT_250240 [Xylona heveae TC161]|uniref:Serine hydrolase domain-containing protein n=1 Tax=Xylona heveae (strain CBS 132557 / TC161) TaxID=1328760 RepID=A0A165A1A2_XYLHT|nr:hypothetical protein L228DRAFT_250240 [Xylona heveae TC161]KZF19814.1 hypothetical protein L228DRAFT_250240 [Xylona heveae TC161]